MYFYRKQQIDGTWIGWEPLELDIQGDHHVLIKYQGRLFLIWVMLQKRGDGLETERRIFGGQGTKLTQINLHWSEKKSGGWSQSEKLTETLPEDIVPIDAGIKNESLMLKAKVIDNRLRVGVYSLPNNAPGSMHSVILAFQMDDCSYSLVKDDSISVWEATDRQRRPIQNSARPLTPNGMTFTGDNSLYYIKWLGTDESPHLIQGTGRKYTLLPPSQDVQFDSNIPFLFSDEQGIFIVRPNDSIVIDEWPRIIIGYSFTPFYHPYVCGLIARLRQHGLGYAYGDFHQNSNSRPGYSTAKEQGQLSSVTGSFFDRYRVAGMSNNILPGISDDTLDFKTTGSYSIYNWEFFFYIPLHTAQLLTQAGKFEEAQKWLHRIFDPTNKSTGLNSSARYWRIAPFYSEALKASASIEELLIKLQSDENLKESIKAWRADPFNPHLLARMRISAYMRKTVLQYLDNLIQWGDYLFRRHTIESINEASHIYIMAYELLGPRPNVVSKEVVDKTISFADFEFGINVDADGNPINDLDAFSNASLEDLILYVESIGSEGGSDGLTNESIISPLFFCIPGNSDLLKYWDIVADRLFKVRHCQDISGRSRSLPLFESPIDPALLVRARAAGLDINSVLDGLYGASKPTHRYPILWQKAIELCNEVRGLGAALLSALEKKDAEQLANIRASHEVNLLELQSDISDQRIEEANTQLASLRKSRENAVKRQITYASRQYMNSEERQAETTLNESDFLEHASASYSNAATVAALIPQFHAQAMASGTSTGGEQISGVYRAFAEFMMTRARNLSRQASRQLTTAGYKRRQEDWDLQKDLAGIDIEQIDKQILAAQIRVDILTKEKQNLQVQTDQSKQVGEFLRSKFTNQSLYTWMSNQLMNVYRQTYDLAVSMALQAQAAANYELGAMNTRDNINSIIRDHWDSQHKGLLAGEKLALQLRRLDSEFLEKNKRKYELTKSISLSRLSPFALFDFKYGGECRFEIPKWLFDMDFSNHANRRIKNVGLTIPAVTGPYTTLAAELTHGGTTIATSNAQNDSGMFDLNFRDDRFLPFEGEDAEDSEWLLKLTGQPEQFDRESISDVIMHISYTAIDKLVLDGDDDQRRTGGLFSVLSLKNQFPREWSLLQESGDAMVDIGSENLSYGANAISDIKIYPKDIPDSVWETTISASSGTVRFSGIDVSDLNDVFLFIES